MVKISFIVPVAAIFAAGTSAQFALLAPTAAVALLVGSHTLARQVTVLILLSSELT